MPKMALHGPFGHLQPKLWAKEGPGVKLPVWLPTTKSQELTSSRHLLKECDMALKSSRGELQLWFRPCPNLSLGRGAMTVQSPRTPTRDSFGTPTWESWEKKPFGCSLGEELFATLHSWTLKWVQQGTWECPEFEMWWIKWVQGNLWLVPTPKGCKMSSNQLCRNPTLRELWGRHSHSRKWDLGVLQDSWKFKMRLQGSKHLALKHS
jgi:hypothetical protein